MKAEAEFATSALTNAGLLATAQHNIATALGNQVNAVKELEAAEELASRKRELAMLQQIKDQQEVLDEAKKKKARAEADLKLVEDDLVRHKVELDKSRATLIESRARKTELTGEATEVPWSMDLLLDKESYDNYIKSAARQGPSIFDQKGTTRPSGADELKLEAPTLDSRIDNSEEEIKKLSDSIKALERKEKRAETAVGVAEKEIKDDTSAVEINIAKVKDDFISQNIAGKSKEVVDLGKQNAADFKGVLDKVTATTALESGAVGDARKIVADQMITAKELPKAIDDMGRLIGSYQAGFMLMAGNAPENLRQMFEILKNLKDQANQSKTLSIQLKDSVSITSETAAKVRALEYQIKILKEQISH